MFAFLNLGVQEMTVLLTFGTIVVVPLVVAIVALVQTYKLEHSDHSRPSEK